MSLASVPMQRWVVSIALAFLLSVATHARAAEPESHATDIQPHAILPEDSSWAGVMVIIILALFLAAAAVGVTVSLNAPPEEPAPAHDDHGHDAHGHGGHDHGHGH
ncbi:MAG TPA: hypothetical protein VH518_10675 [Tepidisphaeraceae bacterium]